jgi:hypothetical protein
MLTNYYSVKLKKTDEELMFFYGFNFRNQSVFNVWTAYNYIKLLQPFDPTNSGKPFLPAGSEHRAKTFGIEYFSKPQSLFTFSFTSRYGGYFQQGTRFNFTTDVGYRIQPYVSIALSTNYNNIKMPSPWNTTIFWLIGPRIDVTFTNTLFFTAFVQYNDQQKNINLNTRFQWRYRPASDLFIVYTDNYYSTPFAVRNRALVLKLNYWWNL